MRERKLLILARKLIDMPHLKGPGGKIHAGDEARFGARSEAFRLLLQGSHHLWSVDSVDEAGKIFDFRGPHQLTAGHAIAIQAIAGEDERFEAGAGAVNRGGPTGRS